MQEALNATLETLAERGYGGLSFEEVASRAGVNKTTLYRRWPNKAELVAAALQQARDDGSETPDSGSLHDDLVICLTQLAARVGSPFGRSLAQALLVGRADPELAAVLSDLRAKNPTIAPEVFDRAAARGELANATDGQFVGETLAQVVFARLLLAKGPVDEPYLHRLVDLVLHGATPNATPPQHRT